MPLGLVLKYVNCIYSQYIFEKIKLARILICDRLWENQYFSKKELLLPTYRVAQKLQFVGLYCPVDNAFMSYIPVALF